MYILYETKRTESLEECMKDSHPQKMFTQTRVTEEISTEMILPL